MNPLTALAHEADSAPTLGKLATIVRDLCAYLASQDAAALTAAAHAHASPEDLRKHYDFPSLSEPLASKYPSVSAEPYAIVHASLTMALRNLDGYRKSIADLELENDALRRAIARKAAP